MSFSKTIGALLALNVFMAPGVFIAAAADVLAMRRCPGVAPSPYGEIVATAVTWPALLVGGVTGYLAAGGGDLPRKCSAETVVTQSQPER